MPRRGGSDAGFPPTLKRLGQHFLVDPQALDRIAAALDLTGTETVVEIGPGRGALTERLLPRAGRVIAIELDRALAGMLRTRYAAEPRVEIVEADVLQVDLASLTPGVYRLAGNVPYYITTPIVFQALQPPMPELAVFLVQREVAERMAAGAGEDSYGALSVNVQANAAIELLFAVPAGAFRPPPKVESAVVRLRPRGHPLLRAEEVSPYRTFVQACFGMRRKQMRRVLRSVRGLDAERATELLARLDIDPDRRPEGLTPEDYVRLLRMLRDESTAS